LPKNKYLTIVLPVGLALSDKTTMAMIMSYQKYEIPLRKGLLNLNFTEPDSFYFVLNK
jgi:hypothetical protein